MVHNFCDSRTFPDDFLADTIHEGVVDIIVGILQIIVYF